MDDKAISIPRPAMHVLGCLELAEAYTSLGDTGTGL